MADDGGWITLELWPKRGERIAFEIDERALERETRFYLGALRYRDRWRHGAQARHAMRGLALGALEIELSPPRANAPRLGNREVGRSVRRMFSREAVLELVLPSLPEDDPARSDVLSFPWEYAFSAAYRDDDDSHHAFVVRRLAVSGSAIEDGVDSPLSDGSRAAYVELTPGALQDLEWDFEGERSMAAAFSADPPAPGVTRLELKQQAVLSHLPRVSASIAESAPWLVHVAGFDAAQAYGELARAGLWHGETHDGRDIPYLGQVPVFAPESAQGFSFVPASQLAEAVTSAPRKPRLVVACLDDSQASVAAECVAHGAGLAIGFQDYVDDAVAEQFVRELYHELTRVPFVDAFRKAVSRAKLMSPSFHGTGIVVYARESLWSLSGSGPFYTGSVEAPPPGGHRTSDPRPHVDIAPQEELNFAMLSNGDPLFRRFYVTRTSKASPARAKIEVVLHVGDGGYRHEETIELDSAVTDLTRNARIPMTWLRDRMPSECVRTTLNVAIEYLGQESMEVERRSHVVTLLPSDSWRDDDLSRQWLPAFVLPRDPGVREVLARGQRHLDVLSGQPLSGFDGYQSIDEGARQPYRGVDAQAEAIWNGFVVDLDLRYVNPPPSYQAAVQRLRTPSGVLRDGRGTCIDLALYYAACLEMVGIWPVLFLLDGHCFVGYWRSEDGMYEFLEDAYTGGENDAEHPAVTRPRTGAGWLFGREYYKAIRREVHQRRQLVPIEATLLTARSSFAAAVRAGKENLRSKAEFHSMMDVWAARDQRVTPLPFMEATGIPERAMATAWSRGAP